MKNVFMKIYMNVSSISTLVIERGYIKKDLTKTKSLDKRIEESLKRAKTVKNFCHVKNVSQPRIRDQKSRAISFRNFDYVA